MNQHLTSHYVANNLLGSTCYRNDEHQIMESLIIYNNVAYLQAQDPTTRTRIWVTYYE